MIDSNHNHAMQPAIQDGSGHASALTNQPAKPGEGKTQDTPWSDRFIAPEDEADDDEEENGGSKLGPEAQLGIAEVAKKKNKKKKPKSKRGLKAPTGFEEYYVDAPMTPAEHEEEQGLYHESLPFRERIEVAIQRYSAKRKLDSQRRKVFDKWLAYGGVDTGPKMFSGGLDPNTLSNSTAAEIRTLTASHAVSEDKGEGPDAEYVVDFPSVVKGYLSYHLNIQFDLHNEEAVKSHTHVIRNFLNYLLYHNVCPEYNDQINTSKDIINQADKELWMTIRANRLLPGIFNTACSEIFGGQLKGLYVGDQEWAQAEGFTDMGSKGISPQMAKRAFKAGLVARGEQRMLETFKQHGEAGKVKVVSETLTGLEVTDLLHAEQEVLQLYQTPVGKGLKPLGRLKAKTWDCPGARPEDLTEEEEAAAATAPQETKEYELWIEDHVLDLCFVGMKFITIIKELSFGVLYFDELRGIFPSFHTMLPNDLMIGWRKIEKTWLPRRETGAQDDEQEQQDADGAEAGEEDRPWAWSLV